MALMRIKQPTNRFFAFIICFLLYMVQPVKAADYVYYLDHQNEQQRNNLVNSYGSTNQISVGVPFQITLVATKYNEEQLVFPDSSAFPNSFHLLSTTSGSSASKDSVIYTLQYYGNQDVTLKDLRVLYLQSNDTIALAAPPISISFSSILERNDATTDSASFKPLKNIYEFTNPWIYVVIGLILLALILGYVFYKSRNTIDVTEQIPVTIPTYRSPINQLLSELESIKNQDKPTSKEGIKQYVSAISDAIRAYYEDLYPFPALESTSRELLDYLQRIGEPLTLTELVQVLLREADRVKFAKYIPPIENLANMLDSAYAFYHEAEYKHARRLQSHEDDFLHSHGLNQEPSS
ncbi:MAG: hypothetical protein EBR32_04060 [Bacteroidetes bacterium]|nr:hypothetical protein [Bacteroidota bacterium]